MITLPFYLHRHGKSFARRAASVTVVTFAALATFAAPAATHAQGVAPATPALARNSGKEYMLAHSSSFNAPPANARNPFWPIGWVPTAGPAQVAAALNVSASDFNVTTISVDAPALAVINGKTRAVGDRIPVGPAGTESVLVKQILDGVVVLDYRGHELRATNDGGLARKPPAK